VNYITIHWSNMKLGYIIRSLGSYPSFSANKRLPSTKKIYTDIKGTLTLELT